jgi:hypothetical protein
VEVLQVGDVAVAIRRASPLQQEHLVLLRQRRRQRAAGSAPAYDNVVVARLAARAEGAGLLKGREILQVEMFLACEDKCFDCLALL